MDDPKDYSTISIRTDRILLQTITEDYTEEIFREFNAEITTYMHPAPAQDMEETLRFIQVSMERMRVGQNILTVILSPDGDQFLGCAGLHQPHTQTPELGIWLKKAAQGNAYGKEAIHALKAWADQHLNYKYLLYPVDKNNYASRRIPESFNAKIGRSYQDKSMDGRLLNILEYRILPG